MFHMTPYKFLCVLRESNGSVWVFIVAFPSLQFLMGPYGSLLVLIRPYGFYWVFMGPYRFLFLLMDSNGS